MQQKLHEWYMENHRKLSFRETNDPYYIWISEVMLQQTQVATVIPYFDAFIKKYPNIETLAKAELETVLKDVAGLGYYRRFRMMHKAAGVMLTAHDGMFPKTYQAVLSLPGIGKYTAGAIMSIAYQLPYSAVDGNVIRVLARFYEISSDMRQEKNKKVIDEKNQQLIEKAADPSVYTQSLMELGATICKPQNPLCEVCPLKDLCQAYKHHTVETLPVLSSLKDKKEIRYITLIIKAKDAVILRKRNEKLLEGFYEYPQFEAESIQYVEDMLHQLGVHIANPVFVKTYKHVFTHQIWYMDVYEVMYVSGMIDTWYKIENLTDVPMATAHKKIINAQK